MGNRHSPNDLNANTKDTVSPADDAVPAAAGVPLRSVHTSNLPDLFAQLGISLVVSTYQAGKVILVRNDAGTLNTHFRTFSKPMGIAADGARLTIGGTNTVWYYRNVPAVAPKIAPQNQHDHCFIPRRVHVTGDIDIHEMAYDGGGELWIVNARFGCLCTLDEHHSFYPRWRPHFVSALSSEDPEERGVQRHSIGGTAPGTDLRRVGYPPGERSDGRLSPL